MASLRRLSTPHGCSAAPLGLAAPVQCVHTCSTLFAKAKTSELSVQRPSPHTENTGHSPSSAVNSRQISKQTRAIKSWISSSHLLTAKHVRLQLQQATCDACSFTKLTAHACGVPLSAHLCKKVVAFLLCSKQHRQPTSTDQTDAQKPMPALQSAGAKQEASAHKASAGAYHQQCCRQNCWQGNQRNSQLLDFCLDQTPAAGIKSIPPPLPSPRRFPVAPHKPHIIWLDCIPNQQVRAKCTSIRYPLP